MHLKADLFWDSSVRPGHSCTRSAYKRKQSSANVQDVTGKRWIRQFLLGATLLPILVSSVAFFVNLIAIYYQTSRAIPFLTMLAVAAIVLFVIIPLNLVGTVLGRNLCGHTDYPCRVNAVPKPIPEKKWFMEPGFLILLAGLLPFGSIFIEL
ncbi:hypothetical protein AHF37_01877 [Paragonimus kellicotti]|nr:hypothetical protein AHF37_01877 [Paragonimus kellicotti]